MSVTQFWNIPSPGPFQFHYNEIYSSIITDVFIGLDIVNMRKIDIPTNEERVMFVACIDGMKESYLRYSDAMQHLELENESLKEQIMKLKKDLSIENRISRLEKLIK